MFLKIPCKSCVVQPLCSQVCDKILPYSKKLHKIKLSLVAFLATPVLLPALFNLIFGEYTNEMNMLFMICFIWILTIGALGIIFIMRREKQLYYKIRKITYRVEYDKHGLKLPKNRIVR
jgi:hypothetical protein